MKNHRLLSAIVLSSLLLAGCSTTLLQPNTVDYKSAAKNQLPPLEVPPDLTTPEQNGRYSVPSTPAKGSTTYSAYIGERNNAARASAATNEVLTTVPGMHIVRSGSERWLVVKGRTADQLWPLIKQFWEQLGFVIDVDLPKAGVMETNWAENHAKIPQDFIRKALGKWLGTIYSTATRDRFRTRIGPGVEPGTIDIYISHQGMKEVYVNEDESQTKWEPAPADPGIQAEMLRRLMVRLGEPKEKAKQMIATPQVVEHAKMVNGVLQLEQPFEMAWRRVGLALDRTDFTVEDRDHSKGLYSVRYVDPEASMDKQSEGFLSKLMFWRSKKHAAPHVQYQIRVKGEGKVSIVQVLTSDGRVDHSETAQSNIRVLFQQLQ